MASRPQYRDNRDHDPIGDVAETLREHTRTLLPKNMNIRDIKVWCAIVAQLGLDTRLWDGITRHRIQNYTGLDPSAITTTLQRLQRRGFIEWTSGGALGKGDISKIRVLSAAKAQPKRPASAKGATKVGKGVTDVPAKGVAGQHPQRNYTQQNSQRENDAKVLFEKADSLQGKDWLDLEREQLPLLVEGAHSAGKNRSAWTMENGGRFGQLTCTEIGDGQYRLARRSREKRNAA